MNGRARFAVDWDDTCVAEFRPDGTRWWPEIGPWLPGAVDALRELSSMGLTVVYTMRNHLYELDDQTRRTWEEVQAQEDGIRTMLSDARLYDVVVYPPDRGKPPAEYIIDDKGVRFAGSWRPVLDFIRTYEMRP